MRQAPRPQQDISWRSSSACPNLTVWFRVRNRDDPIEVQGLMLKPQRGPSKARHWRLSTSYLIRAPVGPGSDRDAALPGDLVVSAGAHDRGGRGGDELWAALD